MKNLALPTEITSEKNSIDNSEKISRKVSFADDNGYQLEKVIIIDFSDVPPVLTSPRVIELLSKEFEDEMLRTKWIATFDQPGDHYFPFVRKLEEQCVALERLSLSVDVNRVVGIVKVKDFNGPKSVFVRYTLNNWQSYNDHFSKFAPFLTCTNPLRINTYKFTVDLIKERFEIGTILEFCICYQTSDKEYWDNNNRHNYKIILQAVAINTRNNYVPRVRFQQSPPDEEVDFGETAYW